jgi:hypothetical protein
MAFCIMAQELFSCYRDWREKSKMTKDMENILREGLLGEGYSTIDKAIKKSTELSGLIDKARRFNERSSLRNIDTEKLALGLDHLEMRIDDDYFSGRLSGR